MKIAIPVSAHDKHLLPDLTECLLKFGGLEEFPVILFPTPAAKDAAYEAAERLGAQTHVLGQDFYGGAPIACNNHFSAVVFALGSMGNTEPFLWMEADMLPRVPRWAALLQEDYRMGGTPFRGAVVDTPYDENGKIVYRDNDRMLMGTGIYPANMERDERIKPLIVDLAKPSSMNPNIPFDVYLRWPIYHMGVSHTELISDMWATRNYRMEGANLVCDSVKHDRVVRERGGPVSTKAVLVHGCKDGSLADIILGRGPKGIPGPIGNLDVAGPVGACNADEGEPGIPGPSEPPDSEDFWGDDEKPTEVIPMTAPEPPVHTVVKSSDLPEAVKVKASEPKPIKRITRADIETALNGKKMRVTDLAEKLGVETPDLIGTFPTNGYAVAKAGWVQNTIPMTEG